jgi:sulfite exporter TauE/SafE
VSGELAAITTPGTAFLAGLVTSLHCAGMCGPLACALMPSTRDDVEPQVVSTVYHASRLFSYAVLGALAGGIGRWPLWFLGESVLRYLPWLLVLFFVAVGLRLDQRLPKPLALARVHAWLFGRLRGGSRIAAAAGVGFATPLLPCGPLYFLLSFALLSGSALRGAETLIAFGLGTVPLLWFAQHNFHWLRVKIGAGRLARLQAAFALGVALVLVWRLRGTIGLGGPGLNDFACF